MILSTRTDSRMRQTECLLCTADDSLQLRPRLVHIGGSRAKAVTSDRHTARLVLYRVSEPIAD